MMDAGMMGGMMAGIGLFGILVILVLVLIAVAAIKYLVFDKRRGR